VTGEAQVWIDDKLAGEKTEDGRRTFSVPFPAADGERTVSVLIEASAPGARAGSGGTVTAE
jgi:hypothetical protein